MVLGRGRDSGGHRAGDDSDRAPGDPGRLAPRPIRLTPMEAPNFLYYGDNLDVLRRHVGEFEDDEEG